MADGDLPNFIIPKHYSLELKPDLDLFIFSGKCVITLEVHILIHPELSIK